jgi:hypothetical protein
MEAWRHGISGDSFGGPLVILHLFRAYQRTNRTKEVEDLRRGRLVWPSTTMACIYSLEDAKRGFGRAMD